jgi:hypothetical protein
VEYFFDMSQGRKLASVADSVVPPTANGELPDDSETQDTDDTDAGDAENLDDTPPADEDENI